MSTLLDSKYRVVSIPQLEAMCKHVSGTYTSVYRVEKVTRSRVHVTFSNEDEYGIECPMTAIFPCYPRGDMTCVVLDYLRITGGDDTEAWQYFEPLRDCPELWNGREYPLTSALRTIERSLQTALAAAKRLPPTSTGLSVAQRSGLIRREDTERELVAELEAETSSKD